jgi:hypothetical protein
MEESLIEVWKENLRNSINSISTFNKWLIVLNLTIALTYIEQYNQIRDQAKLVRTYTNGKQKPWDLLRQYYNASRDSLETYDSGKLAPWVRLSFISWWGTFVLQYNSRDSTAGEAIAVASLDRVNFARKTLIEYGSDITKILIEQKANKSFEDLNRDEILSLINIHNFSALHLRDSFKLGIQNIVANAKFFLKPENIGFLTLGKPASPLLISELSFANGGPVFPVFMLNSQILIQDFDTFGKENVPDSLALVSAYLQSNSFESLTALSNQITATNNKLQALEHGESVSLPLTDNKISIIGFLSFAGLINLIIILYLRGTLNNTIQAWNKLTAAMPNYPKGLGPGYFFNWTWGLKNSKLLIPSYSVFLAFITLLSLFVAFQLFRITVKGVEPAIIFLAMFAILNIYLAWTTSRNYFALNKRLIKDSG